MKGKKAWTSFLILGLISGVFSGCAHKTFTEPCGATDFGYLPKGTVINNVPLPTDEKNTDGTKKNYNLVIPKDSFWMTKECDARVNG